MKPGSPFAVIGAGLAGLSAARRLVERGQSVRVFEKARGVGGRTSTRRHESGAFDHGAQYFTCRSEAFRAQTEDWCRRGVASRWDARVVTLAAGARHAPRGEVTRYVGTPGMNAMAKDLATDLEVQCGIRIARVEGDVGQRMLVSDEGREKGPFSGVIVSTPAPQSVPLLEAAPQLAERAARIAMQPCIALMLTFPEALDLDFDGAFVDASPLSWVARNAAKPGRSGGECWVLHAGSAWSERNLEQPPAVHERELREAFTKALGRTLPEPLHGATQRWRYARSTEPADFADAWDGRSGIGVCGDWTHGDRVEGAWHSGERLALAILESEKHLRGSNSRRPGSPS